MSHTPGPWKVREFNTGSVHGGDSLVASVFGGEGADRARRNPTMDANCRLIAAAPDLLEAAKYVLNDMGYKPPEMLDPDLHDKYHSRLSAAIAKATT